MSKTSAQGVGPPTVPSMRALPTPGRWARWMGRMRDEVAEAERVRVGDELNDVVVRRLFALGLSLESTLGLHPDLEDELRPLIRQTDELIRAVRDVACGVPRQRSEGSRTVA
jgi:signal transduction histidine kinase